MKDSPQAAVNLFDGSQENPELIWSDEQREAVTKTLRKMSDDLYRTAGDDPNVNWNLPNDFELVTMAAGELVVAGVYLRLFVENPSWVLRRPKEFLTELLDVCQSLVAKSDVNEEHLDMITKALTSLLSAQPALLDMVPIMGHIESFVRNMSSKQSSISRACVLILRQLTNNKQCVDTLVGYPNTLSQMMTALKADKDVTSVACETLDKLFKVENEELVLQAINCELVPYLLKLLDAGQATHRSSKALVVEVLKAMCESPTYGQQVSAMLDTSDVWNEFKDQKHDLFIENSQHRALTGSANVAGYLTQGNNASQPLSPPPIDEY
jgi:DnaJ family protein C protein 13